MSPKPQDIKERTFQFAGRVIKLTRPLPRDHAGSVVARQLVRSGTSVGANVEEAQGAHSRKDFARRMNIARTEAREVLYWLRLIAEAGLVGAERMAGITQEAEEILRILVATMKKLREAGEAKP